MPADDRIAKTLDRCDRHPGSPVVARCDGCGRALCLACSTPVRGETYGVECLAGVLGSDAPVDVETRVRAPDALARGVTRAAFGLAVLATAIPWSRFGPGSDVFGAWSRSARWSVLAAVAALAGFALSLAQRHPRLQTPRWDAAIAGLGAVVVAASLLAVLLPPDFSRPWLGPWAAAAFGAVACGSAILAARTAEKSASADI